jgi:formamidopyrimidine-DNA glycosylase
VHSFVGGRRYAGVSMPELPEVESVRRQLDPELRGRRVLRVWTDTQRRFHAPERLAGRLVRCVGRRGKFLISPLDGGLELVLHLGMTGSLHFDPADPYARARLALDDGRELVFRDPRRFGGLAVVAAGAYDGVLPSLARLGPEPLSDEFDPARFALALAATRSPVKPFLLSQRPVAGVGNIYADEALWRARLHPLSPAGSMKEEHAERLVEGIVEALEFALEHRGSSIDDYRDARGERGTMQDEFLVHTREGERCLRGDGVIRRIVISGRSTYFCPGGCQQRLRRRSRRARTRKPPAPKQPAGA